MARLEGVRFPAPELLSGVIERLDASEKTAHGFADGILARKFFRVAEREARVVTREGLTIVGRDSRIPANFEMQRPVMIDTHLDEDAVRSSLELTPRESA